MSGAVIVDQHVARALNEVARKIGQAREVDEVLDSIIAAILQSLPEIDQAGISVMHRDGRIETRASSGSLVTDLDQIQFTLHEGPCVDAMDPAIPDDVVRVDDARHEQRWPRYIGDAVAAGMRSQLGLRLYTEEKTIGGLNLYSTSTDVISRDTELMAELFATHAALALGRVRKEAELVHAIGTRGLVGQAIGIVMERHQISSERSFEYLVRVSQTSNTKLRDLALQMIDEYETIGSGEDSGDNPPA
ncbi:MAG: GAF and ANTAR domain-containing protein [Marmoricola sp.]